MIRYYAWAVGERALSLIPGGEALYRATGRLVKGRSQGSGRSFVTSLPVTRKVQELAPSGGTVMEVGTGWFHHDAFLVYLAGDYRVVLFDVRDKASLPYIRNYLTNLRRYTGLLAGQLGHDEAEIRHKLDELLALPSRAAIYERCNFTTCITDATSMPFLPPRSVDFMVSNCTLVHIPPEILLPELVNLREMLRDGGYMYHHLGHDDHWAFHDPSMSWPSFNYMRYSERAWRLLFQSLEYHNRLVKPEWIDIFARCGLEVAEYNIVITEESREAVRRLPRLAPRFACHALDDLAIVYSYVLLRPAVEAAARQPLKTTTVVLPTVD